MRRVAYALVFLAEVAEAQTAEGPNSESCSRLAADYNGNEWQMAMMHDINTDLHRIDLEAVKEIGTAEARAEAEKSAQKIKADDDEYLVKADRIVTLMLAHRCEAPDHVTDYFEYSRSNPNKKTYTPPAKQE